MYARGQNNPRASGLDSHSCHSRSSCPPRGLSSRGCCCCLAGWVRQAEGLGLKSARGRMVAIRSPRLNISLPTPIRGAGTPGCVVDGSRLGGASAPPPGVMIGALLLFMPPCSAAVAEAAAPDSATAASTPSCFLVRQGGWNLNQRHAQTKGSYALRWLRVTGLLPCQTLFPNILLFLFRYTSIYKYAPDSPLM